MKKRIKRKETICFVIGFVIGVLILFILRGFYHHINQENNACEAMNKTEMIPIYSLNVYGTFTFVYGTDEEKNYYTFYKIEEDGGKVLIKIPTEETLLYNNENENPHILVKTTCSVIHGEIQKEKKEYEIFVPEKIVIQFYNGNLSNIK